MKKLLAVLLVLVMVLSLAACGGDQTDPSSATEVDPSAVEPTSEVNPPDEGNDTLVVGYNTFSQKFSPFFSTTAYDQDVWAMTSLALLGTDREGNVVMNGIEGEVIPYNGTPYTYYGIANCDIEKNDDGTVAYNFTMRDDIVFSDGEPMTIDDAIFSMYVLCDPTYDGSSTLYAQPIVGMKEYRAGMESISSLILAGGREESSEFYTDEQRDTYWAAIDAAGEDFVGGILSYCEAYGATTVAEAMGLWGFDVPEDATAADCWQAVLEAYEGDVVTANSVEAGDVDLFDAVKVQLGDSASEFEKGVQTGESADHIEGIIKTGDYSMTILMSEFDATAIYSVGVTVAPLHYYGDVDAYDYDSNQFGFTKGDLSGVREKTTQPLGAGPYKFVSYQNNVVTFERNENYFLGCPKIKNILFQETAQGDMLTGVASGTFDIADPSFTNDCVESIKGYNPNGELDGDVITTKSVDNLGYGYIGINADTVKVGDDKASDASKALRKAFATLFAVHRDTVINSYYGDRASVINYPISNTSWAAPKPADEGYEIAYSVDVDGNPIYAADMTEDEKYDAALEAAIGFLKAAGYTWDDAEGKFTAAPEGAEMTYEVIIPADGIGDHPAYGILTAAKDQLETIGLTLEINDPSDSNILWDALDAGTQNMWAAAWGAAVDPDMYQVYHSSNVVGLGGTDSNHYHIADENLDRMILEARTSDDHAFRKSTYKECLETILDWAVEIPTYQRQNAFVISTERVNIDTLTPDITTYWTWMNDLELLEMN